MHVIHQGLWQPELFCKLFESFVQMLFTVYQKIYNVDGTEFRIKTVSVSIPQEGIHLSHHPVIPWIAI